jgi:RND family efflux transporter MFP subunit
MNELINRAQQHLLSIALPLSAVILLLSGCREEPVTKPLTIVPAMKVLSASSLSKTPFAGRARAGKEVNLSFRISGPLRELPIKVGDEVEKGDIIARIDPQDYINALGTATGQLNRGKAVEIKAQADYRRILNVYREDPGATSKAAVDLAKAARDSSRATVNSLLSVVKTAKSQLDYTSLHAPFSGIIVSTYVENFETIVPKQPILRLVNIKTIEFIISVPETSIRYFPYVESVTVKFDALPNVEVPATIKEVGREASQSTRTFPVTLIMEQQKGVDILPGMAGSALVSSRLPDEAKEVGIEVPATAIFSLEDPSKSYVWIIDKENKTLSSREVTLGQLSPTGVFIKSGVKAQEWVVIKGVNSVTEGQKVRIADFSEEEPTS